MIKMKSAVLPGLDACHHFVTLMPPTEDLPNQLTAQQTLGLSANPTTTTLKKVELLPFPTDDYEKNM